MCDVVIDVRELDKKFRKKTILSIFDDLPDNDKIILLSDHSLAPLSKLFSKERKGFFEWSEISKGPEIWKIGLKKIKSINLTINEIIRYFPSATQTFNRFGIPYYKLGSTKLVETDERAQEIFKEILSNKVNVHFPLRTDNWSIGFTIDYIINNHHTYVKESIPEIESLIDHLSQAHASSQPQLPMINQRFQEYKHELEDHMRDEEEIVFPAFKKLEEELSKSSPIDIQKVKDSISWMEEDHVLTGTNLKSMRNFCSKYQAPEDSSPGFKILYEELVKFESDMHFHMHLENNILFSKVSNVTKL